MLDCGVKRSAVLLTARNGTSGAWCSTVRLEACSTTLPEHIAQRVGQERNAQLTIAEHRALR